MAEKNIELDSVEVAAAVFWATATGNIRLLENEFFCYGGLPGHAAAAFRRTGQCCRGQPRCGGNAASDRESYTAGRPDRALLHQSGA